MTPRHTDRTGPRTRPSRHVLHHGLHLGVEDIHLNPHVVGAFGSHLRANPHPTPAGRNASEEHMPGLTAQKAPGPPRHTDRHPAWAGGAGAAGTGGTERRAPGRTAGGRPGRGPGGTGKGGRSRWASGGRWAAGRRRSCCSSAAPSAGGSGSPRSRTTCALLFFRVVFGCAGRGDGTGPDARRAVRHTASRRRTGSSCCGTRRWRPSASWRWKRAGARTPRSGRTSR